MRISHHALGICATLIAFAGAAGWVAHPDLRDRVRLMSHASGPWDTSVGQAGVAGVAAPVNASSVPLSPCTQSDLDAWLMPTPPDAASRRVTLYSDRAGAKRIRQGEALAPGVMVTSITPTNVTLVRAGGTGSHSSRLSRQLTAAQPAAPTASPARLMAPLGN